MSRAIVTALAFLAAAASILPACTAPEPAGKRRVMIGEPLPSFELPRLAGGSLSSTKLVGDQPVLINFWATWCDPCIREVPALRELHASGEVRVVSINVDDERDDSAVGDFVAEHGIGYEVLRGRLSLLLDYGSNTLPYTLVLDGDLTVRALHRSLVTRRVLERELQKARSSNES